MSIKIKIPKDKEIDEVYASGFYEQITTAKTKNQIIKLVNKIYEDGFIDGYNEKSYEQEREDIRQGRCNI